VDPRLQQALPLITTTERLAVTAVEPDSQNRTLLGGLLVKRIISVTLALILALFVAAPATLAAGPWDGDEHVVLSTGGDFNLAPGQHADLLVIVGGKATIAGDAKAVVVIDGTVTFTAARSEGLLAIRSTVRLDQASMIAGDVHVMDSVINAPPTAITGSIQDFGGQLAGAWVIGDLARSLLYVGFIVVAMFAALAIAGLASRQVRQAGSFMQRELVMTIMAAFAGLVGIALLGVLAIVTVIGAPLGLGILVVALPLLLVAGYVTAGIWIGDVIVARAWPGVTRERPYLAAVVGVAALAVVSIIPIVGGLISLAGFGAVVLYMWRTLRGESWPRATAVPVPAPSAS
jgi:hypothetical protein